MSTIENSNAAERYGFALRLVVGADSEAVRLASPDREIRTRQENPHSYAPRRTTWAREAGAYGAAVIGFVTDERVKVEHPVILQDPGYGLGV